MEFLLTVMGWLGENVFKSLIDKVWDEMKELGSQDGEGGECGVGDALCNLEISLIKIQPTISRAENLWIKDENLRQNVDKLLVLLKDATYDAEDLLDKFQFQKLQKQIKEPSDNAGGTSLSSSLLSPPTKKRKVREYTDHDVATEIRKIREKLDNISIAMEKLLDSNNRGKMKMINEINRVTSSIPVETQVFGRDKELNELMRLLLEQDQGESGSGSGSESSSNVSILTITGMGGVGKTALAQQAYNDKRVEEYFKLRIWVCVSEDFDVERLTNKIIESSTHKKCDLLNFDALQMALKEEIASKKFLLVLDDVWNEDRHMWDCLCAPLRSGVIGSKILVTTRMVKIANMVASVCPIHLNGLDDDNSWAFFKKCAFGSQGSKDHPRLEAIAKEMVANLKGLPLAMRTLGGLLNINMNEQHWRTIMESEIWKLPQEENGVLLVLQLSYQYLPAHLKRCFAFCSLFPKDYQFNEPELVRIWMAEGFFPTQKNTRMEDYGSGCFQELVSRSFFQKSLYNRYVMHDLMHDLAQLISVGETYRIENVKTCEIPSMLRHLNVCFKEEEEENELRRLVEFRNYNKLRTLICQFQRSFMNSMSTSGLFKRLKSIRKLNLSGCGIKELPESIGDLIHLRYLDISNNDIIKLPNSLFNLCSLQALSLECNPNMKELPESIGDLIYLRYLDISNNQKLKKLPDSVCCLQNLQTLIFDGCFKLRLPQGISKLINLRQLDGEKNLKITNVGKLTSLQKLPMFEVIKKHGHEISELNGLTQLHGTLHITNLENVESKEEAIAAELQNKVHLDELVLEWTTNQETNSLIFSEELLEVLRPNSTLKGLKIKGYNGAKPPSWLESDSLPMLETFSLEDCRRWEDLSFIGQLPHLKSLHLKTMPAVKQISQEVFGSMESNLFPRLEEFVLEDMMLLEELPNLGQISCLKVLRIKTMPRLVIGHGFFSNIADSWFPSLEELELKGMPLCEELPLLEQLPCLKNLCIAELPAVKMIKHGLFGITNHSKCFPKLEKLVFSNIKAWLDRPMQFSPLMKNMPAWEEWSCVEDREWFPCLRFLEIVNCPMLKTIPRLPPSLTSIILSRVGLTELPMLQEPIGGSSSNLGISLSELHINECPNLVSMDQGEWFSCLRFLDIYNCPLLKSLPRLPLSLVRLKLCQVGLTELSGLQEGIGGSSSMSSLSDLHIYHCRDLISLDVGLLSHDLPNICRIHICFCGELLWIPVKRFKEFTFLEELLISECSKLMSMAQDEDTHLLLPPSVKSLILSKCGKLIQCLPDCLHNLTSLTKLMILDCPSIVSFAKEHSLRFKRELRTLYTRNCSELRCIEGLGALKSLKQLIIEGCPKLLLTDGDVHGEGFSLVKLGVSNTALLKVSVLRNTLPFIRTLGLSCSPQANMFEGEDKVLLQSLTSLKYLIFSRCEYLQSLPTELHALRSLKLLILYKCRRMESLPEKGLPKSLKDIQFYDCHPSLENQLKEHLAELKNSGRFRRIASREWISPFKFHEIEEME